MNWGLTLTAILALFLFLGVLGQQRIIKTQAAQITRLQQPSTDDFVSFRFEIHTMEWALAVKTMTCVGQTFIATAGKPEEMWVFSASEDQIRLWWLEYSNRLERSSPTASGPHTDITSLCQAG